MAKKILITIFGASGDLAKLKLFPAIYELESLNLIKDKHVYVGGFSRKQFSNEQFRSIVEKSIREKTKDETYLQHINKFLDNSFYFSGKYDSQDSFKEYKQYIEQSTSYKFEEFTHIFYFSVPPIVFKPIILGLSSILNDTHDYRILIEKPFGVDYFSAKDLFDYYEKFFREKDLFLLDHYLGKQVVESIFHLRKANFIVNNLIRGSYVSNIQISALEEFGVGQRLGYFNEVGIIRDFFQSHLLQILSLITMDLPLDYTKDSLAKEKTNILNSVVFAPQNDAVVLGQYEGYLEELGEHSVTETFAEARLMINRHDWKGTNIYLRAGKYMPKTRTYVAIEFDNTNNMLLEDDRNVLLIELKPKKKIEIYLTNSLYADNRQMVLCDEFRSDSAVIDNEHANLIWGALNRSKLNFMSIDEVLASWKIVGNILDYTKIEQSKPIIYPINEANTTMQNSLLEQDGHTWFDG